MNDQPEVLTIGLNPLRSRINNIDLTIVDLLLERAEVVKEIGEYKKSQGLPVRDPERELSKMKGLIELCRKKGKPEQAPGVTLTFRGIMEYANIIQGGYEAPTGILYCVTCKLRSNGIINESFDWPACPACGLPLFPK